MSTEQIIREALALPEAERAKVAEELLASLEGPEQVEIDAAWAGEIEDRIDALNAGEIQTEPGDEVLRRLRERKK